MLSVEEINRRIKKGAEEKLYDWKPLRPSHDWKLPSFEPNFIKSNNAKQTTKLFFSQVLAFIELVHQKRFSTGCTLMPISTHSRKYLSIWNSSEGVSRAIERMIKCGLISVENEKYRHHAFVQGENYSRTYLYYVDNERLIIDYCENNGIEKYSLDKSKRKSSEKTSEIKESLLDFRIEDVRFSNKLRIVKPKDTTKEDFEDYLIDCLHKNYSYFGLIEEKIKEINAFYSDDRFKIDFIPHIHWSEKSGETNVVDKVTIRATNSFSNKKKIKRYWLKKNNGFVLEKDIKSSVPRLTLSMNLRTWVDEKTDIYELISREFEPGHKFTKSRREAIKKLHMWCYFDDSSDINLSKNIWRKMNKEGLSKGELDETISLLRPAVVKAEGGRLFGVEIFFIESCIYLMTLYDLLKAGIDTWLVYDAFYSKDFEDREKFEEMINNDVKINFDDFLKYYKYI